MTDSASFDLTDRAALEAAVRGVEAELGPVDILVNNAGIVSISGGILQEAPDTWNVVIETQLNSVFLLSNIAALLDVSPRELTDWFWIAYVDAYDWVVEPNVLAMGTYGVGPLMTTKPYVSGAAYINRMSDYCAACAFNPKKNCPITNLYWAYLDRHRQAFADNPRMRLVLNALARRSDSQRQTDGAVFEWVRSVLGEGGTVTPEQRPQEGG